MSIFTAPSAFQVPDCWRTVKFGVRSRRPVHRLRIDRLVMRIEHVHVHAGEIARILAHVRGDFGLRNRERHGPGRIEIDAGDFGGQRRRGLFGLADDHAIAPHDLVVLDRFGECRRKVDDDVALAKHEIHVEQPLQRGLELLDPLRTGTLSAARCARHAAGGGEAVAQLETLHALRRPPRQTSRSPCRPRGPR